MLGRSINTSNHIIVNKTQKNGQVYSNLEYISFQVSSYFR